MTPRPSYARILSIDPTSHGFGYIILEDRNHLVDWGIKSVPMEGRIRIYSRIVDLIELYRPSLLVGEDCTHPTSRRRAWARSFITQISDLASERGVRVQLVPAERMRQTFKEAGANNKTQVAEVLADQFCELTGRTPKYRKPWMSEDERTAIFDALGFALVAIDGKKRP